MKTQQTPFINYYELQFVPFKTTKKYGVLIQLFDDQMETNKIHYEVNVQCKKNKDCSFSFRIAKQQVYINNSVPDLSIEKLIDVAGQTLYPIEILGDRFCQIQSVANFKDIQKRWETQKTSIKNYYTGEITDEILESIDLLFSDENLVLQSLHKDWFFCLYFSPLYFSYTDALSQKIKRNFPVFGNQFAKYKATQNIEKFAYDNIINIQTKGKSIDKRTLAEVLCGDSDHKYQVLEFEETSFESTFETSFKLNAIDRSIIEIESCFVTLAENEISKTTKVEIILLEEL